MPANMTDMLSEIFKHLILGELVTKIEKALYVTWIKKFGASKVKDLAKGLKAKSSIAARTEAIVTHNSQDDLNAFLLEGFRGFFHQTVYIRKLPSWAESVAALQAANLKKADFDNVTLQEIEESAQGSSLYCLMMATRPIEFLPLHGSPVSIDIPFPVAVTMKKAAISFHVLTMKSTVDTWGEIIEKELRKILTPIQADAIHDQAINFIRASKVKLGDYVDYSKAAKDLIKSSKIDTFSGEFEVGSVGNTRHNTVRGKNKQALRESMSDKYQELIGATRIRSAEISLRTKFRGLESGAKMALYPTIGKLSFRSTLEGNDPDEFISALADA